jgi:hypothetical protein
MRAGISDGSTRSAAYLADGRLYREEQTNIPITGAKTNEIGVEV